MISDFQVVIGLEVHAQLLTASKLFDSASTSFGAEPNANTQPLCLGLPGALPVVNQKAVELAARAGLALQCQVRERSVWSRKHYFYPDSPKGYQITQYDRPLCEHGQLSFELSGVSKTVRILRIHMEEDAGKSVHDASGSQSLVDLNRCGTPLIEIVSEPDLRSADEAVEYLKALRDVLVYLGVNDGNLEEGSFRCDANVSVMKKGAAEFGTRCELKNLNSFRFIKQAIEFEVGRQVELIESGGAVVQQTRLYDPDLDETRAMRGKEDAHDYRYFPEPDLPPLRLSREFIEGLRAQLPELPRARRARFATQYGLSREIEQLTADRALADFYEACLKAGPLDPRKLANWFIGDLARARNQTPTALAELKFTPAHVAELLGAVDGGTISANAAREVLGEMFESGKAPLQVIAEKGLAQVSDAGAIEKAVDEVLARSPSELAAWKAGKQQVLGHLVGQVMKAMKGKGNPKLVNELLRQKLG